MRALRPDDRLAVADDGVRELREEERPVGSGRPPSRRGRGSSARRRRSCPGAGPARRARARRRRAPPRPSAPPPGGAGRRAASGRGRSRSGSRRRAGMTRSPTRTAVPPSSSVRGTRRGASPVPSARLDGAALAGARRVLARERAGGARRASRSVRRTRRWRLPTCVGLGARDGALLLRVRPLAPLLPEGEDLGLVERLELEHAAPDDRLERRHIWSNRAMTGPIAPFGVPQTGLAGRRRRTPRSWAWPSASRRRCCSGRARPGRRARGCGSSPAG